VWLWGIRKKKFVAVGHPKKNLWLWGIQKKICGCGASEEKLNV
jgi:CDGSH-type Zn-finger protein